MAKPRDPAATKAAKAEAKAASKAASKQRRSQLWQAFQIQRKEDNRLLPYMIGAFVLIVAASAVFGVLSGGFTGYMMIPLGVVLGALVAFIIFGRRAQKSVYRKADGQSGAAAWALDNLRGKWRVTPGVAATGHFDAVQQARTERGVAPGRGEILPLQLRRKPQGVEVDFGCGLERIEDSERHRQQRAEARHADQRQGDRPAPARLGHDNAPSRICSRI